MSQNLADLEMAKDATEMVKAVCDKYLIMFQYLLWVGQYTVKGKNNKTEQTVSFKL